MRQHVLPLRRSIWILLLGMASCLGPGEAPSIHYYVPAGPPLPGPPGRVLRGGLEVLDLTAAPHLSGDRFAARPSASEVEYYRNHRWAGPLDRLVTEEVRRQMRFYWDTVLDGEAGSVAGFALSGRIERFEEEDGPEGWFGRAALSLTLTGEAGKPVWSGRLEAKRRAEARNPQAVAAALGEALAEVLNQAHQDWCRAIPD